MQQKTTVERVLHYIGRKLRKDADGNEVISRHHAELAAKMAFEGGRQSVVENIPELEWTETTYNLEDYLLSNNNGWNYSVFFRGGAFKVHCNSNFIGQFISLTAAKQAANDDYKQRIKQALGL